jgi:hypothetical protein
VTRRPRPGAVLAALVGVGLALAYVATVGVTLGWHPGRVRPLYEGFTPPSTYHWVDPPRIFAAGNQPPTVTHATVKLGPAGSLATGVSTDDAQLVVGMAAGAVARHGSDTSVAVTITPLAADAMAALPSPYRASGNVYDVAMAYQPSGVVVTHLSGAGASMVLIIPEVGNRIYTTPTRSAPWRQIPAHAVPPTDLTLGATMQVPGYYVGATSLPPLAFHHGSSAGTVAISVGVGVLAVLVLGGGFLLSRRRRRRPS